MVDSCDPWLSMVENIFVYVTLCGKTWGSLGDLGSCRPSLTSKSVYFRCIFQNPLILCTDLSLIKWTIFLQQISPQSQSKVRLVNVLGNPVALYLDKNMEILSTTWKHTCNLTTVTNTIQGRFFSVFNLSGHLGVCLHNLEL